MSGYRKRLDRDSAEMPARQVPDSKPSVEQTMVYQVRLEEVRQAVAALPEKQRAAVLMHKYEEMEYSADRQGAEMLGICGKVLIVSGV